MIPRESVNGKTYELDHFGNLHIIRHSDNKWMEFEKDEVEILRTYLNNYARCLR